MIFWPFRKQIGFAQSIIYPQRKALPYLRELRYRKLTVLLRRRHQLKINKKKVYRLCKQIDVLRPQRKLKIKHPKRLANNRVITASNQLWETDVKYGWISGEQRFFFLMSILDVSIVP